MSSKETEKKWGKDKKEAIMRRVSDSLWSTEYDDGYLNEINIADGLCRIAEHLSKIAKSMSENKQTKE
jgi:hypothetical protein|tara:strand:- start:1363 stop:1566 length:204 start_codon:yes stop_codon:yes gene_type:complete